MVKAQKFVVAKVFEGEIDNSDLVLEEEELPSLQDGEILIEASYLSVDPYMRAYARSFTIGQTMIGEQVAKVIESRNSKYPVGISVVANVGWRTHTIFKEGTAARLRILPDIGDLPTSLGVGVLGMPGNTSYFGFLDICKPKEGETVVVTGAAGAVGSHVGQIAKIKGCTVIGLTGSEDKATWLRSLGFDHVINYKTVSDLAKELKTIAPQGIDCYFDNVGGETSSIIINQMNNFGRISVCGSISSYNDKQLPKATILQPALVSKHLSMRGFIVTDFDDRWFEGIYQNLEWIREKKLKYRETITDGFENTTNALIGVIKGENTGKAIVRVKASNVDSDSIDFKNAFATFKQLNSK